jgi:hypothetical protein
MLSHPNTFENKARRPRRATLNKVKKTRLLDGSPVPTVTSGRVVALDIFHHPYMTP